MSKKEHWENVYQHKRPHQVSWTQEIPRLSLEFLHKLDARTSASIIDVGGGDSNLVDHLLDEGYRDITVLDISEKAIDRAQARLGERANNVQWIVSDVTDFTPTRSYDLWHDRATFHFLTSPEQIERYLTTAHGAINNYLILGTFSTNGPEKCSGLEVRRYDEHLIESELAGRFERLECMYEDHTTPFATTQNFLFCSFEKRPKDIA